MTGATNFAEVELILMPMTAHPERLTLLKDKPAGELLIHEIYRSLQGESVFAGLPCVFVRLAVCDARCVWCDTPHAFNQGERMTLDDVVEKALSFNCPQIEVTGGEPLLQPEVFPLMTRLADSGPTVLLETSGAHDIGPVDPRVHIIMDLKCPDSGECENNLWTNIDKLKPSDEVKFVVTSRRDFDWTVDIVQQHELDRRFSALISPVFGQIELADLAAWILGSGLNLKMQLQLHKAIWSPTARGV
jgi:7-carboxy-7-deazaguanine synthase